MVVMLVGLVALGVEALIVFGQDLDISPRLLAVDWEAGRS